MTDAAIKNAIAVRQQMVEKIAAADEQIKEFRAELDRAERFIREWEEFSGEKAPEVEKRGGIKRRTDIPVQKPQNPKKEEVAEVAIGIIREHGKPMTRDELFAALPSSGITIHGQNPPVVLQTMLWRMKDRIVHLKGHGYWPREDAYTAADYAVDTDEPEGELGDSDPEDIV